MPKPPQRTSLKAAAPRAASGRGREPSLRLARALAACSDLLHGARRSGGLARVLGVLVRTGGLVRAALLLNHDHPEHGLALHLAAEARGNGAQPLPLPASGEPASYASLGLGRLAQDLFKGSVLHGQSADFPESERPFLEPGGPVSTALVPVRHDGAWLGFLRVDAAPSRLWCQEDLALLRVLADLLGGHVGRERAEASLLAGAQALRGMVENMPVLVAAFDAHGEIVFWNRECERVSGFSAGDVLHDRAVLERLFPDEAFRRSLRGRGQDHRNQESRLAGKDGGERIIAWSDISRQYPLPGWKSWRIGVDMSQRLLVEQAVIQAKQEWERTFDSVPDPILILDEDLRVRRLNMALGSRLGVHPRSLVGRGLDEVAGQDQEPGEVGDDVATRIRVLAAGALSSVEELTVPRWGGHFLVAVSPFRGRDDARNGTIVVAHDISRWKELERKLEQSRRLEALGTLAGGIAHDFNNILGVMLGYAEMLQASAQGGPQERRVEEILRAGGRAKELIAQILTFSRKGEGSLVPMSVTPLVKEVLQHLMVTMPQGIAVRRRFDSESDLVLADPSLLHQVVLNLCTNAVQAMRDTGGTLEVAVDEVFLGAERAPDLAGLPQGTFVRLRIRDTGPGISAAIVGRIFDPFFTTKRPGEGTGMGLAVVHGIVHKLGGAIGVDSVPGLGTTMRVLLPRARRAADQAEVPGRALPRGQQAHILLVDDEAALLAIWREVLEGQGYSVTAAPSGEAALKIFAAAPDSFDLLLTDQIMPGMNGTELIQGALALKPGLPVVLCTGYSDAAAREVAAALGVAEILAKPVPRDEMARALGRALSTGQRQGAGR